MFKTLSNWWNRGAIQREQEMIKALDRVEQMFKEENQARIQAELAVAAEREAREAVEQEVSVFRTQVAEDEARRSGTEPWVEIKSDRLDPVKGIHIELDWNAAFIQYLKDNGIKGRDEETIVQKWLAFLYEDLITQLEQQVVDNSDKPRVNDFE